MHKRMVVRIGIIIAVLAATSVLIYSRLGLLQGVFRPTAPSGGWVIDPPTFLRMFLAWYGPTFLALPALYRYGRKWRSQDQQNGITSPRPKSQPWYMKIIAVAIAVVLASGLVLALMGYLLGYTTVSPSSIRVWRLVRSVERPYSDVRSVTILPLGYRFDQTATEGPLVRVQFVTGRETMFGHENGLSQTDVDVIAQFIGERANLAVKVDPDARPR